MSGIESTLNKSPHHMRLRHLLLFSVVAASMAGGAASLLLRAADVSEMYVVAGQSNADGRGVVAELPVFPRSAAVRRWTLAAEWGPAREPWNDNGASPILAFGDRLAELHDRTVGVVAATKGGTAIDQWAKGGDLYRILLERARGALLASPDAPLRGLIWYQGESDTTSEALALAWPAKFRRLVTDLRSDLGELRLPVVMVVIGPDPKQSRFPAWSLLQSEQTRMSLPTNVVRVTAADLVNFAGTPHLTTASLVKIGVRMAEALDSVAGKYPKLVAPTNPPESLRGPLLR